jgi:branched-chain amino acid transport system permease protein
MNDRQAEISDRFGARRRRRVLALISDELIAEHARDPRGRHSAELQEVLRFLRGSTLPRAYVVVAVEHWRDYRVGTLRPLPADPTRLSPRFDGEDRFLNELDAMHEVFLRRLRDLALVEHRAAVLV